MYEQEAKRWRDGDAPPEWTGRTIFTGQGFDGRYYMTDDRDALPPHLITFGEFVWQGIHLDGSRIKSHGEELSALHNAAQQTERSGTPVSVSVGLYEYESGYGAQCASAGAGRYAERVS
jgi:hypothetical protein